MPTVELQRYLIGEDLVTLRRKINWSQQAMADYLGMPDASHVRQIENGRRWITWAEEMLLQQLEEEFESGQLPSVLDREEYPLDPKTSSTGELGQELEDFLGSPAMQRLRETATPHIYITFAQHGTDVLVTEQDSSPSDPVTFGPYLDVRLAEGVLEVMPTETEGSTLDEWFCLATLKSAGWSVLTGREHAAPIYPLVRFHTYSRGG